MFQVSRVVVLALAALLTFSKDAAFTGTFAKGRGQGNAGGWPSTTGNPSGGGRSNNPPGNQGRGQGNAGGGQAPPGIQAVVAVQTTLHKQMTISKFA